MSRARVAAIALAAAVMGLTGEASAGPPEVVAPAAASATPLVLAPGKPLDVAREPTPSGLGWKLLAAAVVVAAGAEFARRRLRPAAGVDAPPCASCGGSRSACAANSSWSRSRASACCSA